jgi:hypothetical protein
MRELDLHRICIRIRGFALFLRRHRTKLKVLRLSWLDIKEHDPVIPGGDERICTGLVKIMQTVIALEREAEINSVTFYDDLVTFYADSSTIKLGVKVNCRESKDMLISFNSEDKPIHAVQSYICQCGRFPSDRLRPQLMDLWEGRMRSVGKCFFIARPHGVEKCILPEEDWPRIHIQGNNLLVAGARHSSIAAGEPTSKAI